MTTFSKPMIVVEFISNEPLTQKQVNHIDALERKYIKNTNELSIVLRILTIQYADSTEKKDLDDYFVIHEKLSKIVSKRKEFLTEHIERYFDFKDCMKSEFYKDQMNALKWDYESIAVFLELYKKTSYKIMRISIGPICGYSHIVMEIINKFIEFHNLFQDKLLQG